ncbi:hypothetical protein DL96DRAFT_1628867 [Flagelloscypha sp. PMI_526]|nr:hypothetical protein DL96DRAFT_1628867 [Flagelloscypha sp. PMI_526]
MRPRRRWIKLSNVRPRLPSIEALTMPLILLARPVGACKLVIRLKRRISSVGTSMMLKNLLMTASFVRLLTLER